MEGGLLALEDLEEDLALQEKTLDLRLSLALSREKHNHRLNALRSEWGLGVLSPVYVLLGIYSMYIYCVLWFIGSVCYVFYYVKRFSRFCGLCYVSTV